MNDAFIEWAKKEIEIRQNNLVEGLCLDIIQYRVLCSEIRILNEAIDKIKEYEELDE